MYNIYTSATGSKTDIVIKFNCQFDIPSSCKQLILANILTVCLINSVTGKSSDDGSVAH